MSSDSRYMMGINCAHDAAASLFVDGQMKVAISEERLSRKKHHEGYPYLAVQYCLDAEGLSSLDQIECIVVNEYPQSDHAFKLQQQGYRGSLITNPSHHLLHAYHAWIASGFNEAAILIVDGSGYSYGEYRRRNSPHLGDPPAFSEMEEAESFYVVREGRIEVVEKWWGLWESSDPYYRFPSLGHMFSMASQYIFGHWVHAGKTMGLAPYGDPQAFPEQIIECTEQGLRINTQWVTKLPPRSSLAAELDDTCRNLAAKVQAELESAMLFLTNRLYEKTQCTDLCLSGGVALNSVANARILQEKSFKRIFVTPAAGDAGIAIGAAMYGHHATVGSLPRWESTKDFHGRTYSQSEIQTALEKDRFVQFEQVADPERLAAEDIAGGRIVAWFEGASEFGPRALGHRSILADARDAGMKARLNEAVKFREAFRPYAASILSEHLGEFFDLDVESPFMLLVTDVREEKRREIASVCHIDDTCRIQTVSPIDIGNYRMLLENFFRITGLPLILNTSLNVRGEPIVETPTDALRCFTGSDIDVLYLEDHRVTKISIKDTQDFQQLVPALNDGVSLTNGSQAQDGKLLPRISYAQTRTGYKRQIDEMEASLLGLIDGRKPLWQVAEGLPEAIDIDLKTLFWNLQRQGLISFVCC